MLVCEHCDERHPESDHYCPNTGKLLAPQRFFPPGTLLDKYRLDEVLGSGNYAAVFAATHTLLNKRVAVKVMLPAVSQNREMAARMAREARTASATGHPNIATVTDMGWSDQGAMYIVMELLEGPTLSALVGEQGPLPPAKAAELTSDLLSALEAVHAQGLVHLDVKPDNLILAKTDSGDCLKLLDFGLAKCVDDDTVRDNLTATGAVLGTPHYISPEHASGGAELDHRADIYAAGAVLYWLLTGQRPLDAGDRSAMLRAVLEREIAAPSTLVPSLPTELDAVVLRALARQAEGRFTDAAAMRQALAPFTNASAAENAAQAPTLRDPPQAAIDDVDAFSLVDLDERSGSPPASAVEPEPPPVEPEAPAAEPEPPPLVAEDDPRFAPPEAELAGPLELDAPLVVPPPELAAMDPDEDGTLHDPAARRRHHTIKQARALLATLGGLAVAGIVVLVALWAFCGDDDPMESAKQLATRASTPDNVLILIETEPKGAEILVDGVRQVSGSIQLPRSGRTFRVRVEKQGYISQTLELTAGETRSIRVKLRRKPKRYQ